jgi:two-component system sensor histidine kinase DesK
MSTPPTNPPAPGFPRNPADPSADLHASRELALWRRINLIYLVFVFLPLLLDPSLRRDAKPWLASLAAIAVFLPLYWRSYAVQQRQLLLYAIAMAVIGSALTPISFGGNTFVIYALATVGYGFSLRGSALFFCAVCLAYGGVLSLSGLPLWLLLPVAMIGGVVMIGAVFGRIQSQRNAELRLTQDEVRRLARMNERERIGRDLHDLLGHTLSLIAIKSELAGKLMTRDAGAAATQISEIESIARKALGEVREAVSGIRASGFTAELAAARLSLLSAGVSLDARIPALPQLASDIEAALALSLREAVTNIVRHAAADRVEVELQADPRSLALSISDDGRGTSIKPGNGLTGMRERIEQLGGRLNVDSAPGIGTRLRIWLPLPDGAAA